MQVDNEDATQTAKGMAELAEIDCLQRKASTQITIQELLQELVHREDTRQPTTQNVQQQIQWLVRRKMTCLSPGQRERGILEAHPLQPEVDEMQNHCETR
jgi:hypothetical protein